jgi:thioredoxin-like negative regulator of GroEL
MPRLPSGKTKLLRSRAFWIGAVALLILAGAALLGPRVKRRFDRWSATRHAERAAPAFAKGDFQRAALDARSALERNPRDVDAMRVMAKSVEAMGAPGALQLRQRLDSVSPGDAENTLAWAKDALAAGDGATAEEVLAKLKPAERNGAPWHDLTARIALAKRDVADAETHWMEAVKLDPKDEDYRLNLATLQVEKGSSGAREAALEILKELSTKPGKRMASLRALLGDAMKHGEGAKAKKLAETLASDPHAIFADKLTHLATLRTLKDPMGTAYLLELRDGAASKPGDLSQLLTWMNEHSLSLMVSEWAPELPPEVIAKPPVCISVTDALARNHEWERIEDTLFAASWGEYDHLRQAYRARALEHLSEEDQAKAAATWEAALLAAGNRAGALDRLAKMAMAWGWERRAEQSLWKLSATDQCPRWVRDKLFAFALKRGDTQQLHTVAKLMVNADPGSIASRNDSVFLGLLVRSTEGKLHERAEALHREVPENPSVASTYGLSLYQRDRAAEAVALMEKFTPEQLREPSAARYYGIFLSATDRRAEAAEFLKLGEKGIVLPEETALIKRARASVTGELPAPPRASDKK